MNTQEYIENINKRYKLGNATEHTFRGDLQQLIESLVPEINATNEPKRQSCGAPDYIITKKKTNIPIGFIEAKDIGDVDLIGKKANKEQFNRYKESLSNIIFTDYLDFYLYRDGQLTTNISIAEITSRGIKPLSENFSTFENLIKDFCTHIGQTIKSPKKLAEMMAGKARLLSEVIEKALNSDEINQENSTLKDQLEAFKQVLIHDIDSKGFADVYAQTIAYGMFAARFHDPTLQTFSRQEAAELIPKSNPFLRRLFGYIAGPDIDDRIKWIVDSLAEIFLACDVAELLKDFGKGTQTEDPIIHFYESFLSEYDPKLRKARGVWYTPQPVVNFIVRAVDDILKTEFGLPQGLADSSKTKIKVDVQGKMIEQEIHKVQILDPATGTGTFLAEVIRHVHKKFKGQQGIWSNYVDNHLLPRLNGFELLMASYAMAHLKLDLLLTETGYKSTTNQRFRVYLTNSLEEYHQDTGTLWANWLSAEANEANHIKRDTPVMCVIGNPPYFGFKSNDGEWISELTREYKFIDGIGINEKKHRLGNDYVKFIRLAQHFIDKNKTGILAFINDHGFLFNPTFKGMRWNLLKSFDKIYILDLHGNAKKKEKNFDGSKDENVFDIQQGVSINIFLKTGTKSNSELAEVYHLDILGKRDYKYEYLYENNFANLKYQKISPTQPFYFFQPSSLVDIDKYETGFIVSNIFNNGVTGTVTGNDSLLLAENTDELIAKLEHITSTQIDTKFIKAIHYRPFDNKAMLFVETFNKNPYPEILIPKSYRSRFNIMKHLSNRNNYCMIVGRQGQVVGDMPWNIVYVSNRIVDLNMFYRGGGLVCPLYLYPDAEKDGMYANAERTPNLNMEIVNKIAEGLGLEFVPEKEETPLNLPKGETLRHTSSTPPSGDLGGSLSLGGSSFAPIDILDYIYAVLHSPTYRETYKEFLKIDFPRVPYPSDKEQFWKLVKLGEEIRQIHLLESPIVEDYITEYPEDGTNEVEKIKYDGGRVYINSTQYFNNVPEVAWNFYIGGYQPAQKWLKDRKGRILNFDDILHYQKIIVALTETDRLMKAVDEVMKVEGE